MFKPRKLLQLTSFRFGCLLAVAAVSGYIFSGNLVTGFFQSLDNRLTDFTFQLRGGIEPGGQVVIIDIDERSLGELGQWPWPRNDLARLLQKLDEAGCRVAALDLVFAEPDRTSARNYLAYFRDYLKTDVDTDREGWNNDATLGRTVAETKTILGYFFELDPAAVVTDARSPFPEYMVPVAELEDRYPRALGRITRAAGAVLNVSDIAGDCLTEGFFNAAPDATGVVRRVPLFIRFQDFLYPSLALEAMREFKGVVPSLAVGPRALQGLRWDDQFIPLDATGSLYINYRGPPRTFPYISAVDILQDRADQSLLRGRIALIGTSVWGLRDLRATPFAETFPGVEIHATIIDNLLQGDPLKHDPATEMAIVLTLILVGGILMSLAMARSGPISGVLIAAVFMGLLLAGHYVLFVQFQRLIGVAYPALAFLMFFIGLSTFNYFHEGREKRYIREAFGRYVSPAVVNELIRSPGKLELRGEEKNITVMFSDIRNFTGLAERLSPRQTCELLNEYFTVMTEVIMAHQGTVDKLLGDAVMAMWGAPLDDEQHAVNAVRAALSMKARLAEDMPPWKRRHGIDLMAGIGINTGMASVGNMGSRNRFDYTVIGDNVNLASRLDGLVKVYGVNILISETTRNALGSNFLCRPIDIVRVKGRHEPVKIFEPVGEGNVSLRLRQEIGDFSEMFNLYQAGAFQEALKMVKALQRQSPQPLYEFYRERLQCLLRQPPAGDWQGVYEALGK